MTTAQVMLTNDEAELLQSLSQQTGKSQDELLHEAVESFLGAAVAKDRQALLRQARGIWKERQDLPKLQDLRNELDR
jgi:hypothetical protein